MKQFIGKIRVGDLLHNLWSTDTIFFEEKYVHDIPTVLEPGISWEIHLQTLNNYSIQGVLKNIVCKVEDISDISGESYIRDVVVPYYEAVFSLPLKQKSSDEVFHSFEDVYEIDNGDFSIDIENCISNAIKSQEPIVKIKNDESLWDWWIDVVDISDL